MAQWGRPGTELGDGFYDTYDYPAWYLEYLRLVSDGALDETEGVDSRELWAHAFTYWDDYVLPDLARFYHAPTHDLEALYARPWRWLRGLVLSLFGIRDSLTGATFARTQQKDGDT